MLTIKNLDKIKHIGSTNWYISAVAEYEDLYGFAVLMGNLGITFYLNRENRYVYDLAKGKRLPQYRLYKNFDQSKINRWMHIDEITPYKIQHLINEMLNE